MEHYIAEQDKPNLGVLMTGETAEQPKGQAVGAVKATEVAQSMRGLRRAYYTRITEAHDRGEFVAWTMWGGARGDILRHGCASGAGRKLRAYLRR